MKRWIMTSILAACLNSLYIYPQGSPNILFILADDLGVDAIKGFKIGGNHPQTPNIDKLRNSGLTFTNVWAAPTCSATRASLLTGKYGINNGVNTVPGFLSLEHKSIFKEIKEQTRGKYKTCLVGKWHLSRKRDYHHPNEHGVDEFMGVLGAGVSDYYNWDKVEKGKLGKCTTYASRYFTDFAIDWITKQKSPWFMWLAHLAPHTPFHLPPQEMYSEENTSSNKGKFKAMIESLDFEIGRLLRNIPEEVLANTIVVFLGDNGTPGRMVSGFPIKRGKQTIYQGGVTVPLIISGKDVSRKDEMEHALINVSDFYSTFTQIVNPKAIPGGRVYDGVSFKPLLSNTSANGRQYNFMAMGANKNSNVNQYAIRNWQYKLLDMGNGRFEYYDLQKDNTEQNNLLNGKLTTKQQLAKEQLLKMMSNIREGASAEESQGIKKEGQGKYPIVHTGVSEFYSTVALLNTTPDTSNAFYWQDAGRVNNAPSYTNNGDGTITDNITGLMWQKNMGEKKTFANAEQYAQTMNLGGYNDWRIPTVKELYSLILFTGQVKGMNAQTAFIDTEYFVQPFGDESAGERSIDAQTWTSTKYTGKTMNADETIFGVNFVDGRIKGYPVVNPRSRIENTMYFRMVRGNIKYGKNSFINNGDGTVSDYATGLMWQKADDGAVRNWEQAIKYCESLELAGYNDWHLPNIKELQSIVDYQRSPSATNSAAINPIFGISEIKDPEGNTGHFPSFWASTTHLDGAHPYSNATYISFGKSLGKMRGNLLDVHGAGAQRSEPKTGNVNNYPVYRGPQGDLVTVYNYCRAVRYIDPTTNIKEQIKTQSRSGPKQKNTSRDSGNNQPSKNYPPKGGESAIDRLDADKDGKISRLEARGPLKENFNRIDNDNDGFVTFEELQNRRRNR